MMETEKIAALLEPFLCGAALTEAQFGQLAQYLDLLARWNAKINLTAVRKPEAMVTRHFGESLFAAVNLVPRDGPLTAIDLGSGAGFPGLPLAIYSPALLMTLIESQSKKATFLKEVVRALGLNHVSVFAGRGEQFAETGKPSQLVTMRAVEKFEASAPVAAGLVEAGGRLALFIGESQAEGARQMFPAFAWEPPRPIPQSQARVLLVGRRS